MPNARLPGGPQPAPSGGFPPLHPTNGAPRTDRPQDRILQQLSGLTGTTITLSTKTNQRYEGVIASTGGDGDTAGVTLKDVKEITSPGQPLKDVLFVASTNIETWSSGPADAKAPNGDTFKTDIDISFKAAPRRERELQAWADDIPENSTASGRSGHTDELTFGLGAHGNNWDQFAANEKLFGVKAGFDEEAYTTKLDRNAPDFKEKEKKAQALANEIMAAGTNNTHIAEERVMNFTGDNGTNEEDKYGAVVRGANAYVPPGARKGGIPGIPSASKPDVPKVAVNGQETPSAKESPKPASPAPGANTANMPSADPVPAFRNFVSTEKDRLLKKKQALMKNEMDKRMAELVKFSQTFKLNKPIPEDLVTILAKDEDKQRQIREKSTKDAESNHARSIGPSALTGPALNTSSTATRLPSTPSTAKIPTAASPQPSGAKAPAVAKTSSATGTSGKESAASKRINMFIQPIPPFKSKRSGATPPTPAPGASTPSRSSTNASNTSATPLSPTSANRLNVNASSFRPTTKASAAQVSNNGNGPSSSSASPKNKPSDSTPSSQGPPNPFFGTRVIKKTPPVHLKDDFNPFKYHKVADASQVAAIWPYSGKRYMQMFPPLPVQPQQQSPHMAAPVPPQVMPPQTYEEVSDPAAQAAARGGFVYAYPPYGYPGQPMMPGMPPPGPYGMPQYMPPMPYPHMPPPNAMYPGTPMGQMPPPQAYMAPPPGSYPPPPNGTGPRPSMPPTPIPSHAHPYYHQSPQRAPGGPPHPYEGAPAPPVPMGGHA
ncbi:hypothetical protein PHLCEN_2v3126 [Hermanssonia centrifuga]|uniref:LsmAD domain-containing protein n=1 Tax=Hermanssonia centrifuga TaxID=98765 RepID=A0A2R6R3X9_9APHY|nr:hypothetical protein PHLCEN_2v3126 [Hermanssonia centrifuga]